MEKFKQRFAVFPYPTYRFRYKLVVWAAGARNAKIKWDGRLRTRSSSEVLNKVERAEFWDTRLNTCAKSLLPPKHMAGRVVGCTLPMGEMRRKSQNSPSCQRKKNHPPLGSLVRPKPTLKGHHPQTHLVRMGKQTFSIFQARYLLEILWSTKSSKSSSYLIRAIEKWKLEHLASPFGDDLAKKKKQVRG